MILKTFQLRTILTVTTGLLLTKSVNEKDNGIGDLYKILEHITGEAPFTHTLGRFSEEAKPYLLNLLPELASPEFDFSVGELKLMLKTDSGKSSPSMLIDGWLSKIVSKGICKSEYEIGQISNHVSKNPIEELDSMIGGR